MINKIDKKENRVHSVSVVTQGFDKHSKITTKPQEHPPSCLKKQSHSEICPEMRLTNPEQERQGVAEETLKKLLDMNEKYLIEKIKVSDVPSAARFSHKMPSKTGKSEYNKNYSHVTRGNSVPQKTVQFQQTASNHKIIKSPISGYQSTYHQDFAKKASSSSSKSQKTKYQKSDAPTFNQTSYKRDYGSMVPSPTTSAKRVEVRLMGGGKLLAGTTYQQNFRMKTQGYKPMHPIRQKNNKIFLTINALGGSVGSSYKDNFGGKTKKKVGVESCKPKEKYNPIPSNMKYKTEYSGQYIEQSIMKKNAFGCLSPEELKNYVMTILND